MSHMRSAVKILAGLTALVALAPAGRADDKVLQFDTMAGVMRPYTGAANPVRGVNG